MTGVQTCALPIFVFGLPVFVEGFPQFQEAFLADAGFQRLFGGVEAVGEGRGARLQHAFGRLRALALGAVDPGGFGASIGVVLECHSPRLRGACIVTGGLGFLGLAVGG